MLAIIALLLLASPAGAAQEAHAAHGVSGPLQPGAAAPAFTAPTLDGGSLSLASLKGHVVLLNFWALDCPPCRVEMPELEKIHRRYSGRGLRVVGVTEMNPDPKQAAQAFEQIGATYPAILDAKERVAALYRIEAHPTTFVIDAAGVIRFVNSGYLKGEEADIERAVEKALAARERRGSKP